MANYQALKDSVNTNGEVIIRLDTGEKIELHKHNVQFNDATGEIIIEAPAEKYFIHIESVSYYWIHKKSIEKE
jgi:hypothetical protein